MPETALAKIEKPEMQRATVARPLLADLPALVKTCTTVDVEELGEYIERNLNPTVGTTLGLLFLIKEMKRRFNLLDRKKQVDGTYRTIRNFRGFDACFTSFTGKSRRLAYYLLESEEQKHKRNASRRGKVAKAVAPAPDEVEAAAKTITQAPEAITQAPEAPQPAAPVDLLTEGMVVTIPIYLGTEDAMPTPTKFRVEYIAEELKKGTGYFKGKHYLHVTFELIEEEKPAPPPVTTAAQKETAEEAEEAAKAAKQKALGLTLSKRESSAYGVLLRKIEKLYNACRDGHAAEGGYLSDDDFRKDLAQIYGTAILRPVFLNKYKRSNFDVWWNDVTQRAEGAMSDRRNFEKPFVPQPAER